MKCAKCYDAVAGFLDDKEVRITSLESHNRELLAVIEAKDEALNRLRTLQYQSDSDEAVLANHSKAYDIVEKAIAIKPGDIALIEAMDRNDAEWNRYKSTGEGTKFYILQKKEGK